MVILNTVTFVLRLDSSIGVRVSCHIGAIRYGTDSVEIVVDPSTEGEIVDYRAVLFGPEGQSVGPAY